VTRTLLALASVAGLALPTAARADWLRALPSCAMGEVRAPSPTRLLYPRPGLAAVVRPGERLVTRVLLPAPLTPPPGIQQERALRGWNAELLGSDTRGLGTTTIEPGAELRYHLRVADVRPDAHSTLVYRASIDVPPYAAPGVYSLRLSSPWSRADVAVASVVVTAEVPRVARVEGPVTPGLLVGTADVFLLDDAPEATLDDLAVPWVDARHPGALLSVGDEVLAVGGCDDPHLSWAAYRAIYAPGEDHVPGAQRAWEHVRVVVPEDGRATRVEGELVAWFPAVPARPAHHRPSVVGVFRARAVEVERGEEVAATLEIHPPDSVEAGRPAHFTATATNLEAPVRVAWSFTEDGSVWAPLEDGADLELGWVERQEIHALAIDARGVTARAHAAVFVETEKPRSCSASSAGAAPFWPLVLVLCRIRRARYNRRARRRPGIFAAPPRVEAYRCTASSRSSCSPSSSSCRASAWDA